MTLAALVASDMRINLLGGGLVVLGLVLLVATLAFWRSAVQDHALLAPLEVMAGRRFSRASASRRVLILNKVRPGGDAQVPESGSTTRVPEQSLEPARQDEPDPRAVRRLRGREPRRANGHDEPPAGGFIDPLLNPRNTRE